MKKTLLALLFLIVAFTVQSQSLYLSEIFINPPGTDSPNEYIEVRGEPYQVIPDNTYIIQVDGDTETGSDGPGDIEQEYFDISGLQLGANGYLVAVNSAHPYTIDPGAVVVFGDVAPSTAADGDADGQSHTILLITSPNEVLNVNDDIDENDDGEPDGVYLDWIVHDSVGFADDDSPGLGVGEFTYGRVNFAEAAIVPNLLRPSGSFVYSTSTQFDYAARLGKSTGYVVDNDPTVSDWLGSDVPSGNLPNWVLTSSSTAGRIIPDALRGEELDHIGGENFPNKYTGSGSWTDTANWSTGAIPTSYEVAVLESGAAVTIAATADAKFVVAEPDATLIANAALTSDVAHYNSFTTTNWYLVGAPVVGETESDIQNNNLATGTAGNLGFSSYSNTGTPWSYITASSTATVNSGQGYAAKLGTNGILSLTGTVNTADVSTTLTVGDSGFNLVGNPYIAHMNSATFLTSNSSALTEQTIWIWDGSAYQTKVAGDNYQLSPGEGFFIEATAAGNVTFAAASQSHTGAVTKVEATASFELTAEANGVEKSTKVSFAAGKTDGFDNGSDGSVFTGISEDFILYTGLVSDASAKKLAKQALSDSGIENTVIPVGLVAKAGEEVTFSVVSNDIEGSVYLENKATGEVVNLSEGTYKTTLENDADGTGQFYVNISSKSLSANEVALNSSSVYKSGASELTIAGLSGDATVELYSVLGKSVFATNVSLDTSNKVALPTLSKGIYVVKVTTEFGDKSQKIILD